MPLHKLTPRVQTAQQLLSSAALSDTYTLLKDGYFQWAGFQADGSITETATVSIISSDGSAYDIVLDTTNISGGTNYIFNPTNKILLRAGDGIKITCTKATATETVSSTISVEEIETYA